MTYVLHTIEGAIKEVLDFEATLLIDIELTMITLLRIPHLVRFGSTKLAMPKWHKYGILNRVIRVGNVQ